MTLRVSVASGSSLIQSDPARARALSRIYSLLVSRARGSGLVIYRGCTLVESDDLVGVLDTAIGGERGPVAVWCEREGA